MSDLWSGERNLVFDIDMVADLLSDGENGSYRMARRFPQLDELAVSSQRKGELLVKE